MQTKEPKTPETPQADPTVGSIWTPGFLSGMGSGSSLEDISEGSGVKNDALLDYNEAMAKIAMHSQRGKIQPLTFQLTTTWEESKPEEKELCIEKATEACRVVCSVIAPKDGEKLFQAIQLPAPAEHESNRRPNCFNVCLPRCLN